MAVTVGRVLSHCSARVGYWFPVLLVVAYVWGQERDRASQTCKRRRYTPCILCVHCIFFMFSQVLAPPLRRMHCVAPVCGWDCIVSFLARAMCCPRLHAWATLQQGARHASGGCRHKAILCFSLLSSLTHCSAIVHEYASVLCTAGFIQCRTEGSNAT